MHAASALDPKTRTFVPCLSGAAVFVLGGFFPPFHQVMSSSLPSVALYELS